MSKISTIHSNFVTLLSTTLGATWSRMPNPYAAGANSELTLKKGYGLAIGPGQPYPGRGRMDTASLGLQRSFTVVLSQKVTALESDASGRATIEKTLVEAFYSVLRAVEGDNQLSGQAIKIDYASDSGIVYPSERARYLTINITFLVVYQEQL